LAESLEHLGVLRLRQGRSAEAEAALRRAVALRRSRAGGSPVELAESLNLLGLSLAELYAGSDAAKVEESVALHREALALSEREEGKESVAAAVALFDLARTLLLKGTLPEPRRAQRRNLEIQLARRGPATPDAISQRALAGLLVEVGHLREAESLLRAALARAGPPAAGPSRRDHDPERARHRARPAGAEPESRRSSAKRSTCRSPPSASGTHSHRERITTWRFRAEPGKVVEALALHERALPCGAAVRPLQPPVALSPAAWPGLRPP
jgi:hypothetical protein